MTYWVGVAGTGKLYQFQVDDPSTTTLTIQRIAWEFLPALTLNESLLHRSSPLLDRPARLLRQHRGFPRKEPQIPPPPV